jgi:hypothetical protein
MQSVTGELEAGEAQGALAKIGARQRGSVAIFYALQLGLLAGFAALGWLLGWGFNALVAHRHAVEPVLTVLVGLWVGVFAYRFYARRFLIERFRKRMSDRGLGVRFSQTLTIRDDALERTSGLLRTSAPWELVTEVFKADGYWVFLVQMSPWFAPRRFFASEAEERAFIRAALAHLNDEGRARSKDAVAFAGDATKR